jgi:uracil-DNA glycosylase family 4
MTHEKKIRIDTLKPEFLSLLTFLHDCYEEDFCTNFSPCLQKDFKRLFLPNSQVKSQTAIPLQSSSQSTKQSQVKMPSKNNDTKEADLQEPKPSKPKDEPWLNNINQSLANCKNIEELNEIVKTFEHCPLKTSQTNTVFYDGSLTSKLMLIGEAPGEDENIHKIPFCGRSGKLLMEAFKSINLTREKDFLISNCVFYRPPANRAPTESEMQSCKPFVEKLIELQNIDKILLIGSTPLKNFLKIDGISTARQKLFNINIAGREIKLACLYHPSYLLRNPIKKRDMYTDLLWLKHQAKFFEDKSSIA